MCAIEPGQSFTHGRTAIVVRFDRRSGHLQLGRSLCAVLLEESCEIPVRPLPFCGHAEFAGHHRLAGWLMALSGKGLGPDSSHAGRVC